MDDLLTAFKEARRRQRELYARLEAERIAAAEHDEMWNWGASPDWSAYTEATAAFNRAADRFADYLLGVD